jgi:butyrate kinase
MEIKKTVTIQQLKEMTYDCDEFWAVVGRKGLWDAVEFYIQNAFEDENGIVDFSAVQDALRYEGNSILVDLGVDL